MTNPKKYTTLSSDTDKTPDTVGMSDARTHPINHPVFRFWRFTDGEMIRIRKTEHKESFCTSDRNKSRD